jgi:thiamine biosynthesis protein ThiS
VIRVNDKWEVPWQEGMTVEDVLAACNFTHHYIAVSVDGTLVPSGEYSLRAVADGAEVKVVHIIGGG